MSGFGGNPRLTISTQRLSFSECHRLYQSRYRHRGYTHCNISSTAPGRSNYWIELIRSMNPTTKVYEECYALLMYRTHIHKWFEDGSYRSRDYNSGITRSMLSAFGPVRVWSDSKSPFIEKARFGSRDGPHYPYGGGIEVDPEGNVIGERVDQKERLKPGAKEERAVIRNNFRQAATSRILLGEFGETFCTYHTGEGWGAKYPTHYAGIGRLLLASAEHEAIDEAIARTNAFNIPGGRHPTKEAAMAESIECMVDSMLVDGDWLERYDIPCGPINIKGW